MRTLRGWQIFAPTLTMLAATAGLRLPPAAATASDHRPSAFCRYEVRDTASPGFWITPSRGSAHGIGTITCVGAVLGRELAGNPGRFEWWYSYGADDVPLGLNSCALAGGSGHWAAELPTAGGPAMPLTGQWRATGNFVGVVDGELGGLPARMIYQTYVEAEHADENCVMKPASHGRAMGEGTLG